MLLYIKMMHLVLPGPWTNHSCWHDWCAHLWTPSANHAGCVLNTSKNNFCYRFVPNLQFRNFLHSFCAMASMVIVCEPCLHTHDLHGLICYLSHRYFPHVLVEQNGWPIVWVWLCSGECPWTLPLVELVKVGAPCLSQYLRTVTVQQRKRSITFPHLCQL